MKNHILGNRIARSVLLVVSLGLLLLEDSVCSVQRAEPLLVPAAAHPKAADPAAHPVTTASLTTVGGVVQDKYTREPISNALVRVSSPAIQMRSVRGPLPGISDTRTDRLGRFEVQVPSNEMISVNALAPGYEEAAGPWMN